MADPSEETSAAKEGTKGPKGKGKKAAVQRKSSGKGSPWTFPKNILENAIQVSKAIEEKHAGNAAEKEHCGISSQRD